MWECFFFFHFLFLVDPECFHGNEELDCKLERTIMWVHQKLRPHENLISLWCWTPRKYRTALGGMLARAGIMTSTSRNTVEHSHNNNTCTRIEAVSETLTCGWRDIITLSTRGWERVQQNIMEQRQTNLLHDAQQCTHASLSHYNTDSSEEACPIARPGGHSYFRFEPPLK